MVYCQVFIRIVNKSIRQHEISCSIQQNCPLWLFRLLLSGFFCPKSNYLSPLSDNHNKKMSNRFLLRKEKEFSRKKEREKDRVTGKEWIRKTEKEIERGTEVDRKKIFSLKFSVPRKSRIKLESSRTFTLRHIFLLENKSSIHFTLVS